jgi:DNA-binding NarL/FixJ family response regulator
MPLKRNPHLTAREADVLAGLLLGYSNKRIAAELNASPLTVKVHVKAIVRKLNVSTRTEAAILIMQTALLEPCPRCGFHRPSRKFK